MKTPEDVAQHLVNCFAQDADWMRACVVMASAGLTPGEERGWDYLVEGQFVLVSNTLGQVNVWAASSPRGERLPPEVSRLPYLPFRELLARLGEVAGE